MKQLIKKALFACCMLLFLGACVEAVGENPSTNESNDKGGHLFIIGGGERPDSLMTQFVELAGGKTSKILIVPFASGDQQDAGSYQQKQFVRLNCGSVNYITCTKRQVDLPENLAKLDGVTGIFFSDGDQNVLTDYLQGTQFLDRIRAIHKAGGVVGGTSAGAAVMSQIMLTGDERNVPDADNGDFRYIKENTVDTAPGFGFVTTAIIDQHFIIRRRQNRLISLVLKHPELKGIGIDEATAIIVRPNGEYRVAGQSQVMVFEAESKPTVSPTGYYKPNGLKIQRLTAGDSSTL